MAAKKKKTPKVLGVKATRKLSRKTVEDTFKAGFKAGKAAKKVAKKTAKKADVTAELLLSTAQKLFAGMPIKLVYGRSRDKWRVMIVHTDSGVRFAVGPYKESKNSANTFVCQVLESIIRRAKGAK